MVTRSKAPSQRQLKVGELLRHALAELLVRDQINDPIVAGQMLTVSEVAVSPDLKQARVFVIPLGGQRAEEIVDALNRSSKYIRGRVAQMVALKFAPTLRFYVDDGFSNYAHINALLNDPRVVQDLDGGDEAKDVRRHRGE